jgi:D-beta-D-heptose 7-phosphate kinase/D-beta-D-heptose 1-phosphate adenosyltransferase
MEPRNPPRAAPVLSLEDLRVFLREQRGQGKRIVFTNGCFDLIHAGHIHYLGQARALGDCLVLGLNSDASVRRLKGEGRPLVSIDGRAAVLAALRFVDAVVVFEEDTPRDLILAIRPDVLAKGGDYAPETVVGASDLPEWGGVLRILPFVPGHSTSSLVLRIRNSM